MKQRFDLLKKLYGENIVSKCCLDKLLIKHSGEGDSFYVCRKCCLPSDPVPAGGIRSGSGENN
jgi:hypothetical protein